MSSHTISMAITEPRLTIVRVRRSLLRGAASTSSSFFSSSMAGSADNLAACGASRLSAPDVLDMGSAPNQKGSHRSARCHLFLGVHCVGRSWARDVDGDHAG